jgi:hypothetical protein
VRWQRFTGPLRVAIVAAVVIVAAADEGAASPELIAAGAVVAWWSVIVALAVGRVGGRSRASVPRVAILAGGCLVGLAALSFLSLAWASDGGRAFAVAVQAALYAGVFVLVIVLSSPGDGRSWLGGLALGLATVCAVALVARLVPGFDADADLFEVLPTARGRLSFPVGYWNGLGALAAFGLILLAWLGARGRERLERAVATAAIPLPVLTLYLSSSRGAIAAAALGLVALVALGPARTRIVGTAAIGLGAGGALVALTAMRSDLREDFPTSTADSQGIEVLVATAVALVVVGILRYSLDAPLARARIPRIAGAIAASIAVLALVAGAAAADPGRLIEEFRDPPEQAPPEGQPTDRRLGSVTGHGRWQFWRAAADGFREEPLRGIGAGGFEAFWNQHGTLSLAVQHAHSIFLEYLAELGPLGLLLIVGALGVAAACALKRRIATPGGEAGAAGAAVLAATLAFAIDWSWSIPGVAMPVVILLAVATGPATVPAVGAAPRTGDGSRSRAGIGLATATILLAWGAIWAGGVSLFTEIKIDQSQAAAARDDLTDAVSNAEDAITLQPWAAEPRLQLGLVHELEGELPAARERLLQAAERAPEDWSVWFVLSRVERSLGDREAAWEARQRAFMLLPIESESGGR